MDNRTALMILFIVMADRGMGLKAKCSLAYVKTFSLKYAGDLGIIINSIIKYKIIISIE